MVHVSMYFLTSLVEMYLKISYVVQIHLNIEKFFVILSVAKNM